MARRPSEASQNEYFGQAISASSKLTGIVSRVEMLFTDRVPEKTMQWKRNAEDPIGT